MTTTPCPDCDAARKNPGHHGYAGKCIPCAARMLSHTMVFLDARAEGSASSKEATLYKRALKTWGVTHADVMAWVRVKK